METKYEMGKHLPALSFFSFNSLLRLSLKNIFRATQSHSGKKY
jgi:hypothetical protein